MIHAPDRPILIYGTAEWERYFGTETHPLLSESDARWCAEHLRADSITRDALAALRDPVCPVTVCGAGIQRDCIIAVPAMGGYNGTNRKTQRNEPHFNRYPCIPYSRGRRTILGLHRARSFEHEGGHEDALSLTIRDFAKYAAMHHHDTGLESCHRCPHERDASGKVIRGHVCKRCFVHAVLDTKSGNVRDGITRWKTARDRRERVDEVRRGDGDGDMIYLHSPLEAHKIKQRVEYLRNHGHSKHRAEIAVSERNGLSIFSIRRIVNLCRGEIANEHCLRNLRQQTLYDAFEDDND